MPQSFYAEDFRPSHMSTKPPILNYEASAKTGLNRYIRDIWAVADQALMSASNFATMVLVAHGVGDPAEFGRFTLVYSALLFANILQVALITQPHNVLGATRHGEDYKAYTTSSLLAQMMLIGLEFLPVAVVMCIAFHGRWSILPLLITLIPSIASWQLQEFARRVMYTEGRHFDVFLNDLISYGGQTVVIAGLDLLDRLHFRGTQDWVTGVTAMYALAGTSALAAAIGFIQIRKSLTRHVDFAALPLNWKYGKWLAGSEILTWCSSIQMYLYVAGLWLGTVATGELKAAQVLFGPTRVIAYYLDTVLPIRFARSLAGGGRSAINTHLRKVLLKVAIPLALICGTIALLSTPLLRLTFGRQYAGAGTILVLYSVYALLSYLQMMITAALRARHLTHVIFLAAVCGLLVAVPTSFLLMPTLRTHGIIIAMIAGVITSGTISTIACLRPSRQTGPSPSPADVTPIVEAAAAMAAPILIPQKEETCPN
jgi:O-antigen/teichoic acid export membrane protein